MKNNNFLNSKEGTSFVKLLLWIIFIVILFVMFSSNKARENEKNNQNNDDNVVNDEISFKSLEDMENNLIIGDITYKYVVNNNGVITIYNGFRCNNLETFYKEESNVISKYIKENNKIYKVILDTKEEVSLEEYSLEYLFNKLKEYSYIEQKDESSRTINYNTGTLEVSIKTNLENITKITIIKDSINYQMQFTNTQICDNID